MKPITLTIAGSDCSSGAGLQADIKTFQRLGVHGLSAVTCIVSETPHIVTQIEPTPIPLLQDQINLLLKSYPVSAIKTGLLPTRATAIGVLEILKEANIPLIVDPVMMASSGALLVDKTTLEVLKSRILPITTLVTPNIDEASTILGRSIHSESELESSAKEISEKHQTSCLLKGGHLPHSANRLDVLWHKEKAFHFTHPTIDLPEGGIHGTGCALSAAITAGIAKGEPLETAVKNGITLVQELIKNSYSWNKNETIIPCLGW